MRVCIVLSFLMDIFFVFVQISLFKVLSHQTFQDFSFLSLRKFLLLIFKIFLYSLITWNGRDCFGNKEEPGRKIDVFSSNHVIIFFAYIHVISAEDIIDSGWLGDLLHKGLFLSFNTFTWNFLDNQEFDNFCFGVYNVFE